MEKTLILGNIEGRRRMGRQRMRQLNGITNSMDESEQAPGVVMDREAGGLQSMMSKRVEHN